MAERNEALPDSRHDQAKRINNSIAKDAGSGSSKEKFADANPEPHFKNWATADEKNITTVIGTSAEPP